MSKLTYSVITSLDGYVADERGNFTWAAPDEEVHGFINDLERPVGTYLYGRRLYEVMRVWETMPAEPDEPIIEDYTAIWRAADKVVYSTTLPEVTTPRTRLQRSFDPADVQRLKADSDRDVSIGGPPPPPSPPGAEPRDVVKLVIQ